MNGKYDIELLVNVARMYYIDGLKQDEIAKRVNVSRSLISLILTKAKEQGIVDIKINDPRSNNEELAGELKWRFNLQAAYVVPTSIKEQDFRLDLAVRKGIEVFNGVVKPGYTIGISWGKTIFSFMTEYRSDTVVEGLEIVPLVGATNRSLQRYQMNEVVRQFAEKVNGTFQNWEYTGDRLNVEIEMGEMHRVGDTIYFHSPRNGGKGGNDIWRTSLVGGRWEDPVNMEEINSPSEESLPWVSEDENEIFFTRTYRGTPGIFRSVKVNETWSDPELILSQFAGEPTLDGEGNLYFVHHYYESGDMIEADIYYCQRL